jgi:rod shape determining protein RodA
MLNPRRWRHFDFWLLGGVALLVVFGIAMIRSAIAGNETLAGLPAAQTQNALLGLVVLLIASIIDYHFWRALTRPMYLGLLVLLLSLEIGGSESFGAARWLDLGFTQVQPSELAKTLLIIILADDISRNEERIRTWGGVLRSLALAAVPAFVIFRQPDLSTAILTMVLWAAIIFAAGIRPKHMATLAGSAMILPIVAFPFLQFYQKQRLVLFLAPDADPGARYNVDQALISIGSGGWFGQGYGDGTQVQLRFLKVRHTDFIFSALSEEFGWIGAVAVLLVLAFVIYRCLRAARMARDTYGALIAYGVATLIFYQAAFNIGMNLNLLPVAGLPLPFISYGGSSLWSALLGVGLVESVVIHRQELEF